MTFFAGDELPAADLNAVTDAIAVRATQSSAQTGWTSATYNTITFTSEDFDWGPSGGVLHDTSTNTGRINIGQKLGLWAIQGTIPFTQSNLFSRHVAHLTLNGTAINGAMNSLGLATAQFVVISTPLTLVVATSVSDFVELQGFVTRASGTDPIGTSVSGELRASFSAFYLGPQT